MGLPDIKGKVLFEDERYFADVCNAVLHDGRQVIEPHKLQKLPNSVINYAGKRELARDLQRKVQVRTDGKNIYEIIGIENMDDLDYAMVVRDGDYYFSSFSEQVREIRRTNKEIWKKGRPRGLTKDEWLRKFRRDEKLMPVVNIMVLWNGRDWDGPTSLFEMLETDDPGILSMMNDYKMKNIVIPARMTEEDFTKFKTDTGKILKLAKESTSKKELMKIINSGGYEAIDIPAADYISEVLKIRLNTCIEGDKVNMCRAMEEIREYKRGKGKKQGRKQGITEGIKNTFIVLQSFGIAEDIAIERMATQYGMTPEKVRKILTEQKLFLII